MKTTHLGPGLWLLSQLLLLLYFKMDNGSNVCGIEFNFKNKGGRWGDGKKKEKKRWWKKRGKKKGEGREGEEEKDNEVGQKKDDTKSLMGTDLENSEMYFNDEILRQLFLGFKVESEEGRCHSHSQKTTFFYRKK